MSCLNIVFKAFLFVTFTQQIIFPNYSCICIHMYIFLTLFFSSIMVKKALKSFQPNDESLPKQFLMFVCLIRFWDDGWTFPSHMCFYTIYIQDICYHFVHIQGYIWLFAAYLCIQSHTITLHTHIRMYVKLQQIICILCTVLINDQVD